MTEDKTSGYTITVLYSSEGACHQCLALLVSKHIAKTRADTKSETGVVLLFENSNVLMQTGKAEFSFIHPENTESNASISITSSLQPTGPPPLPHLFMMPSPVVMDFNLVRGPIKSKDG